MKAHFSRAIVVLALVRAIATGSGKGASAEPEPGDVERRERGWSSHLRIAGSAEPRAGASRGGAPRDPERALADLVSGARIVRFRPLERADLVELARSHLDRHVARQISERYGLPIQFDDSVCEAFAGRFAATGIDADLLAFEIADALLSRLAALEGDRREVVVSMRAGTLTVEPRAHASVRAIDPEAPEERGT